MTIQIVNGDLLEASEDILGHQVNCQGVMGSGIAKILRDRYPNLYPEYKKYCDQYTPDEPAWTLPAGADGREVHGESVRPA